MLWMLYVGLLLLGSNAFAGGIPKILFIVAGSLFGMLLPKLVTVFAEIYLVPSTPGVSNFSRFTSLFWQDSHTLMPTTKMGQMIYSYPFLFAFGAVALYIATSSDNWFGKALVLGMGLRLVADLFISNRDKQILKQRWFTAFATRLSDMELDIFVYGTVALFVFITILALRA